jgi:hypothetical protein
MDETEPKSLPEEVDDCGDRSNAGSGRGAKLGDAFSVSWNEWVSDKEKGAPREHWESGERGPVAGAAAMDSFCKRWRTLLLNMVERGTFSIWSGGI